LGRKSEGKRHSEDLDVGGRYKMDHREIEWECVKWIHLVQDSEHGNEPSGSINGGEFLEWFFKMGSAPWSELVS